MVLVLCLSINKVYSNRDTMFDNNLVINISNNYFPFKIDQINLARQEIQQTGRLFITFNIFHASLLILKNAELDKPLYESKKK